MKIKNNSGCNRLVECASTIRCSTSTWDFFALQIELVVVGDLFVFLDFASRVDDDLLVAVDCDYFCITIWITRMIDKPGQISTPRSINNSLIVETKHINTRYARSIIALLTMISDRLSNDLTNILDNKLLSGDILHGEETPSVNIGLGELERLLAQHELRELEDLVNVVVGGHEAALE